MSDPNDLVKRCSNCSVQVNRQSTYCPFCGSSLVPSTQISTRDGLSPDLEDNLSSLYKPPYLAREKIGLGVPEPGNRSVCQKGQDLREVAPATRTQNAALPDGRDQANQPPPQEQVYSRVAATQAPPQQLSPELPTPTPTTQEHRDHQPVERGYVLPLACLMGGMHLVTLGIILLFASTDGVVHLQWKSHLWPIYLLGGGGGLYLGVHALHKKERSWPSDPLSQND